MKKAFALYRLCGLNFFYLLYIAVILLFAPVFGMYTSFLNNLDIDSTFIEILSFVMAYFVMPIYVFGFICLTFKFHVFHKPVFSALPYRKSDIFRAMFRLTGIGYAILIIAEIIGLCRQLKFSYMLAYDSRAINEVTLQQIIYALFMLSSVMSTMIFHVFFILNIVRRDSFTKKTFQVYCITCAPAVIVLNGLNLLIVKLAPANMGTIIGFGIFIIAQIITMLFIYNKEAEKL